MVGSELLCVNLAVVDFLCCICFYPLSIVSSFHHAWLGENITCVYYGLGCFIFGLCSMFTITAISIIRYLKTCYSLVYGEGLLLSAFWSEPNDGDKPLTGSDKIFTLPSTYHTEGVAYLKANIHIHTAINNT